MIDLPAPLVSSEVDVRDLDGFMLNVERLMASELVALSSHEVVAAALFLWCRAWKQLPAASLPDDDRVIAAFSRMSLPRFRKLKGQVLRGFIKCSDGRLYHRVLCVEAKAAFSRKKAFFGRREKDAERLRQWRQNKTRNADGSGFETSAEACVETNDDTRNETRFVREGKVRYGKGPKEEREDAPPLRDGAVVEDSTPVDTAAVIFTPEADLFRRGKEVLGPSAGGFVRKLLSAKSGSIAEARAAIETASVKGDPREYLGKIVAGASVTSRDVGGVRSSRDM